MEVNKVNGNHSIKIDNREKIEIEGVLEVLAFNEDEIELDTEQGMMIIKGQNLHVNKLNLDVGQVCLEGEFEELSYNNNSKNNGSFMGRLFKG